MFAFYTYSKIPITTYLSLNCLTCDLQSLRNPYIVVFLLLESLKSLYAFLFAL